MSESLTIAYRHEILGEPVEVACLVCFLASDDAPLITGQASAVTHELVRCPEERSVVFGTISPTC